MGDGGKGDRNRVENLKAWRENYDKIFGKSRDLNGDGQVDQYDDGEKVVDTSNIECLTPAKKAVLDRMYVDARERAVLREILEFLEHIDLEEYPVQKAKELYKKYLTVR
jgi:hypothetical protein